MRRWFFAAVAIVLLAGNADAQSEWQEYVYADQQFAVSFPGKPGVSVFPLRTPNGTVTESLYSATLNAAHFEVTVFDLLRVRMDGSTAVARAAYRLRANGAVKLDAAAEVQGNWGRDLEIITPDGDRIVAAVFFRNDRLYVIQAMASGSEFEALSAYIIRFQQSVRFVGDPRPRRFAPDPSRSLQDIGGRIFGPTAH